MILLDVLPLHAMTQLERDLYRLSTERATTLIELKYLLLRHKRDGSTLNADDLLEIIKGTP